MEPTNSHKLANGELEHLVADVSIWEGTGDRSKFQCTLKLTNARILFKVAENILFQVRLEEVIEFRPSFSFVSLIKSKVIKITARITRNGAIAHENIFIAFNSHVSSRKFLSILEIQIARYRENFYNTEKSGEKDGDARDGMEVGPKWGRDVSGCYGIERIRKTMEFRDELIDSSLSVAFRDLRSLFERVEGIVAIVEELHASNGEDGCDGSERICNEALQKIGIAHPITYSMVTDMDLYYDELAREIDEFLKRKKKLVSSEIYNNVITLTDLYCIWNRARGISLISPEDMLSACKRLEKLNLSTRLITLQQGALAIAYKNYDEIHVLDTLISYVAKNEPISITQLSTALKIPIPLSTHYLLLLTEKNGTLCIDESIEGLKFWLNKFL